MVIRHHILLEGSSLASSKFIINHAYCGNLNGLQCAVSPTGVEVRYDRVTAAVELWLAGQYLR